MALGDISVVDPAGQKFPSARTFRTEAAGTTINAGEPCKIGGTGNNYVVPLGDGEPEPSADVVAGVASTTSTETASADGVVDVILPLPGVVFRCSVTTPANMDTDAELLAILNDRVTFDLAGGVYTVDENEGDNADHGLRIIAGDIVNGTVDFFFMQEGTIFDGTLP
jgi:hypothetical protein